MSTSIDVNKQINWHTKLRASAGFCIALGVLRIIACQLAYSFSLYPHRVDSTHLGVFWRVAPFIVLASVLQIFAGIYGVRRWGEPKKAVSVAVMAGLLALVDGAIIVGTFVLWIKQTLFSVDTIFSYLPPLPMILIFTGGIAVFMYAHSAYTYAMQTSLGGQTHGN